MYQPFCAAFALEPLVKLLQLVAPSALISQPSALTAEPLAVTVGTVRLRALPEQTAAGAVMSVNAGKESTVIFTALLVVVPQTLVAK